MIRKTRFATISALLAVTMVPLAAMAQSANDDQPDDNGATDVTAADPDAGSGKPIIITLGDGNTMTIGANSGVAIPKRHSD